MTNLAIGNASQHLDELVRRESLGRHVEQAQLAQPRGPAARRRARRPASIECNAAARMPRRSNSSTWSFISEMSGDTTSVVPGSISAGS